MANKERIGVMTSGGDCAGLNAAIRAVVLAGEQKGYEVVGIKYATRGVIEEEQMYEVLTTKNLDRYLMKRGGTFLRSINKSKKYKEPLPDGRDAEGIKKVHDGFARLGIKKLISIGGDGSFAIMKKILEGSDIQFVTIPKTIDNDVAITEKCIGFDSAIATTTKAADDLQATAESHSRVMILEAMGRDSGNLALHAGVATGADVILIPEIPYNIDSIVKKLDHIHNEEGRDHAVIVVSEAIKDISGATIEREYAGGQKRYGGTGDYVARQIADKTDYEIRHAVLGHAPRGCAPNANDRILASAFGAYAVELIDQGKSGCAVCLVGDEVISKPIDEVVNSPYPGVDLDGTLVKTARALGICLGD